MTKEEKAVYQKAYKEANKEELAAYNKAYTEANKEEIAAKRSAHYEANKDKILAQQQMWHEVNKEEIGAKRRAKRNERGLMLFNYKGAECNHCGLSEPDHLEIYDYHHVDPNTKVYTIAKIITGPMKRTMTEVDKCLLLCANCHRKEHAKLNKEKL